MFDLVSANQDVGANFAPLDTLQHAMADEDSYKRSSLQSYICSVASDLNMRNIIERREMNESARLMSALRSGKMMIMADPVYGRLALIKPLPQTTKSDKHVHPLAQVNSTQLTAYWSQSKPRTVTRIFGNTNQSRIIQATLEEIIQHYDAAQMDEHFHQSESLSAMDFGTIAIRSSYDQRLNQIKQVIPILENRTKKVFDGYGYCQECLAEGKPTDFQADGEKGMPRCKKCGSYNVSDMIPQQMVTAPMVIGGQEYVQGDIAIDLVPIHGLNWDMRFLLHNSDWVDLKTEVSSYLVKSMLNLEIPDEDSDLDDGLRVLNALGTRGGSVEGWGRNNLHGNYEHRPGRSVLREIWLKPEFYAGCRAEADEKGVSGVMIKKDQPYTDVFPQGMYAIGFNDMKILIGLFNEPCRIKSTVYHIQSQSGVGKGTTDAIEVSQHLSVAHSAAIAIIKRFAAGGGTAYDSDLLNRNQAMELMKPGGLVGIKMRGSNYQSVQHALQRIEAGELGQGNLAMIAQLSNMLNIVFQTTDFTSGVADSRINVDTASGQAMLQAQNQQRSAAPLRMKAYLRARVFEDVLELFRLHIKIPRLISSQDKYSLSKGRFISGVELPEKIFCDSVPGTELPTNKLTKRDNFLQMLEKVGGAGVNFFETINTNPRMAAWMASEMDVETPIFNYIEILTVCQKRLDWVLAKSKEEEAIYQMAGLPADPLMLAEMVVNQMIPPVTSTDPNAVIKAEVLREYLDDDIADSWTPVQTATVQALIWRHYRSDRDFRGQIMGMEQETQLALEQRAAMQQMGIQAAAGQMQQEQQANQQQQMLQGEVMNRMGDQMASEADFEREQDAADRQTEREEQRSQKDHQRNMELEKTRLKSRNQPKGKA